MVCFAFRVMFSALGLYYLRPLIGMIFDISSRFWLRQIQGCFVFLNMLLLLVSNSGDVLKNRLLCKVFRPKFQETKRFQP